MPWSRDELLQLRACMLTVGHHAAPEKAAADAAASAATATEGGASASADAGRLEPRELREYRRATDYLLVVALLHASPELSSEWQPMLLHTQSNKSFAAMGDESRKGAAKADARHPQFSVSKSKLVNAAGGTPRPSGRAPTNDQGVGLVWIFARGKWYDCSKAGTVKGVRQCTEAEREELLAENTQLEARMAELEEEMYEEWRAAREANGQPGGDATEGEAAGSGASEGGSTGSFERALRQLEVKVRPAGSDTAWLVEEAKTSADTWLKQLLELRQEDEDEDGEGADDAASNQVEDSPEPRPAKRQRK